MYNDVCASGWASNALCLSYVACAQSMKEESGQMGGIATSVATTASTLASTASKLATPATTLGTFSTLATCATTLTHFKAILSLLLDLRCLYYRESVTCSYDQSESR